MASKFAGNALCISVLGGVFPLFARIMFTNLKTSKFPIGWGSSILGCFTAGMIIIPVLFYLNGPKLRARWKYSGTE